MEPMGVVGLKFLFSVATLTPTIEAFRLLRRSGRALAGMGPQAGLLVYALLFWGLMLIVDPAGVIIYGACGSVFATGFLVSARWPQQAGTAVLVLAAASSPSMAVVDGVINAESRDQWGQMTALVTLVVSVPLFVIGRELRNSSSPEGTGPRADELALDGGDVPSAWRWDEESNAYFWWDGERHTMTARWTDSGWEYAGPGTTAETGRKVKTKAQNRARVAFWWSLASTVLPPYVPLTNWVMSVAIMAGVYLVIDTFRQARQSSEVESVFVWVAISILLFGALDVVDFFAGPVEPID